MQDTQAAENLLPRLPAEEVGCPYLDPKGKPVNPDPATPEFSRLIRHYGKMRGAWPVARAAS